MRLTALKTLLSGITLGVLLTGSLTAKAVDNRPWFRFTTDNTQSVSATISFNGGVTTEGTMAGRFWGKYANTKAGLNSADLTAIFCSDASHTINWGQEYENPTTIGRVTAAPEYNLLEDPTGTGTYFYGRTTLSGAFVAGGLESALTSLDYLKNGPGVGVAINQRDNAVAWLTDRYLNRDTMTANELGAVQIAIWDIVQDGGDGVTSGLFRATSNGTTLGLVGGYITEGLGHLTYVSDKAFWSQSPRASATSFDGHYQEFIYSNGPPIPEPAFYQFGALAVLGGLAFLRRRR